jgi:hydroxymethylglutaryl-CoA synthase
MVGIESFGYYLPRYSIRTEEYVKAWGTFAFRGVEEKTVPGYDEDELTMAVEAARRALDLAGEASGQIDLLVVASASAREPFGGGLAEALGLLGARVVDATGPSAGVAALASAFDALGHRRGAALVASADAGRGTPADPREHALGAGAAAFVLSPRGGVEPVATASRSGEDYGGTPRDLGGGAGGTAGGEASLEALRGALGEVLKGAERRPLRLAVGEEDGRFAHEVLGPILAGEPTTPGVVRFAGYTGASGPLLNLVVALGEA